MLFLKMPHNPYVIFHELCKLSLQIALWIGLHKYEGLVERPDHCALKCRRSGERLTVFAPATNAFHPCHFADEIKIGSRGISQPRPLSVIVLKPRMDVGVLV